MKIHLQMWMTYSANFSLIHSYFSIWLDPLPTIMSFANNSQNISFKNVVLILCLDFVATSLWDGNLLPWLQVSRSSRRKSMLSQCSGWEVLCLAFVSVNCILCLLCLFVPWTEAQCLLPERYLVVRQMWLDDGGYCDWVRQYGDSSKFWWEWWGADCYSITWWRRCWKGSLVFTFTYDIGGRKARGPTLIKMKRWHWMNYELLRLTRDPFWWQWIHIRFSSIIIVFCLWQLLCFHQTFKRKYFQTFHQVLPIYTTEQIKLYRQSKY